MYRRVRPLPPRRRPRILRLSSSSESTSSREEARSPKAKKNLIAYFSTLREQIYSKTPERIQPKKETLTEARERHERNLLEKYSHVNELSSQQKFSLAKEMTAWLERVQIETDWIDKKIAEIEIHQANATKYAELSKKLDKIQDFLNLQEDNVNFLE